MTITFGDKDAGMPHSPNPGQLVAFGRYEVTPDLTKPRVKFLVREKGKTGFRVYEAKLDKGAWVAKVNDLPAGAYEVRVELEADRPDKGDRMSMTLPDFSDNPNYIEVRVK